MTERGEYDQERSLSSRATHFRALHMIDMYFIYFLQNIYKHTYFCIYVAYLNNIHILLTWLLHIIAYEKSSYIVNTSIPILLWGLYIQCSA